MAFLTGNKKSVRKRDLNPYKSLKLQPPPSTKKLSFTLLLPLLAPVLSSFSGFLIFTFCFFTHHPVPQIYLNFRH